VSALLSATALRELRNPAPIGSRHTQIVSLARLLMRDGFSCDAIFAALRPNYDPASLPDCEIHGAIDWAEKNCRAPNKGLGDFQRGSSTRKIKARTATRKTSSEREKFNPESIQAFLQGFSCSEAELFDASPIQLPGDFRNDTGLIFETLFLPHEKLNVVMDFRLLSGTIRAQKANPRGKGITKSRNEWLEYLRNQLPPENEAGAWFRINPTNGCGVSDSDITAFRFVLLESDRLPIEIQFSILAKIPIPVSAIVTSGGKSIHAWVRIAARTLDEYRNNVANVYSIVAPLGFDSANRNPSRLSRLPGVRRMIGAHGDGRQRLLYLNHSEKPKFPIL
jgi:hypothetical protein